MGLFYVLLLVGLYLADWLATLRGDESQWAAPAALTVGGVTVTAVYTYTRRHRRPTIPSQRGPTP